MSTRRATVVDNRVTSGTEFGILLNVADGCTVKNNTLTDIHNPDGDVSVNSEGKALFIYGAGANLIAYNRFEKKTGYLLRPAAEQTVYQQTFVLPEAARGASHTLTVRQKGLPSQHTDTELANLRILLK